MRHNAVDEAYKAEKGWSVAWFSWFGSDFNYDFHVTPVFHVDRVIGRYEIQGTVTCIPAPPPGVFMTLAELAVEGCVQDLLSDRMLSKSFGL